MRYMRSTDMQSSGKPQKARTTWRRWAVVALVPMALTLTVQADDDEPGTVVQSGIKHCPSIKIANGKNVQLLDLAKRGFLGVEVTALSPELRQHFGVQDDQGVMISRLVDGSAAGASGLQVGDIVTAVDGSSIDTSWALGKAIRGHQGGDVVDVEYWRDGKARSVAVTLAEQERCGFDVGTYFDEVDWEELSKLGGHFSEEALESIDWESLGNIGVRISEDALSTALQSLQGVMQDGEWETRLERELEGVEVLDMDRLEERMGEVQERLERLEEQLEKELEGVERQRKKVERDRERDQARLERARERQRSERWSEAPEAPQAPSAAEAPEAPSAPETPGR